MRTKLIQPVECFPFSYCIKDQIYLRGI